MSVRTFFELVFFSYVRRRIGDKVAHGLTKLAQMFNFYVLVLCLNDVDPSVISLIVSDKLEQ